MIRRRGDDIFVTIFEILKSDWSKAIKQVMGLVESPVVLRFRRACHPPSSWSDELGRVALMWWDVVVSVCE